jgi:hypothetical protein
MVHRFGINRGEEKAGGGDEVERKTGILARSIQQSALFK